MGEVICYFVGLLIGSVVVFFSFYDEIEAGKEAVPLIEQCQQYLPRNQYCTIKAVVAEETQ